MEFFEIVFMLLFVSLLLFFFVRFVARNDGSSTPSRLLYSNEYNQRINAAKSLAEATVSIVQSQKNLNTSKFLFCNDIASADAVFFSCFILRVTCIMSTQNRTAAEHFSDSYISYILKLTKEVFLQEDITQEMFDNRTNFYDQIISSKGGLTDGIPALMQKFEFIIQTDLIEKRYVPFSSYSPIPVMDIFYAMECRAEIYSFIEILLKETKAEVDQAIDSIK